MLIKYKTILFFLFILVQGGCKKFIEVDAPVTSTNAANVFASDATATAVLTGIYGNISAQNSDLSGGGLTSLSLYPALSADELTLYNVNDVRYSPYYKNNLTVLTSYGVFWNSIYPIIFVANSAIEGLNNSTALTPAIKQQLFGEAKFIRAFCYFYLVNLYGDVPLIISTDYKVNSLMPRSPKGEVYNQIISDLKDAKSELSTNYLKADALTAYPSGAEQRVRPTKMAAIALLARVYLFAEDYINAEAEATNIISNSTFFSLPALTDVFKLNSKETIWSLQPVRTGKQANTGDGAMFVLPSNGPNISSNVVYLSNNILNSFEVNDQRKSDWIANITVGGNTYSYAYKYKIGAVNTATGEYIMMLRLAEQYLIRAEARAQQNNIAGSQSDLNAIRSRAHLGTTTANDKQTLLAAIMKERRVELFTEWGHRWFDLKRTKTIDDVMVIESPQKGGSWSPYKALYPIPQNELARDPNLEQNTGF